jgi:hypothetical protein
VQLDPAARLKEGTRNPVRRQAEQTAGIFKMTVDEGLEIGRRGRQVLGGARMAHGFLIMWERVGFFVYFCISAEGRPLASRFSAL